MEAKDRVMTMEQIQEFVRIHWDEILSTSDAWKERRMIAEAQDEISFKAGYESGFVDAVDIANQQAYEAGVDAGRLQRRKETEAEEKGMYVPFQTCPHCGEDFSKYVKEHNKDRKGEE
jgi:hypothetical protein